MKRVVVRRLILALAVLGALLGAAAGTMATVSAAAARPDFTMNLGAPQVSVPAGGSALVPVQIGRLDTFADAVTLSLAGAPLGSSVLVTPQPNRATDRSSTIAVAVPSSVRAGRYPLTVIGTSRALRHTRSLDFVVTAAAPPRITVSATPSNVNVRRGSSGSFAITLGRTNFPGPIALSVRAVPAFASAAFTPAVTSGNSFLLTVATTAATPLGSADLVVTATSGALSASTIAHLTVAAGDEHSFSITGSSDRRLTPGVTGVVDVTITNPNPQSLDLIALNVTLAATSNPACTLDNFRVTQFRGRYPLTIPARSTRNLSQLGVPQSAWPTLTLVDLPVNQNACKNNTLSLTFTANGTGK